MLVFNIAFVVNYKRGGLSDCRDAVFASSDWIQAGYSRPIHTEPAREIAGKAWTGAGLFRETDSWD